MILPQFKQLGAGVKRGCSVALQRQTRGFEVVEDERSGLVVSSKDVIAEVRSEISDVVVLELEGLGEWPGFRDGEDETDTGVDLGRG